MQPHDILNVPVVVAFHKEDITRRSSVLNCWLGLRTYRWTSDELTFWPSFAGHVMIVAEAVGAEVTEVEVAVLTLIASAPQTSEFDTIGWMLFFM